MEGAAREPEQMNAEPWRRIAIRYRSTLLLAALGTVSSGIAMIAVGPTESSLGWLAFPMLTIGALLLTWVSLAVPGGPPTLESTLARKLLRWMTLDSRAIPFFPLVGAGIALSDLAYNWILSATPAIQTEDTIVLLAALTIAAYPLVPQRFARERDFVFLFFICLNVILVVPLLLARAYYADFEHSVDVYSWVALAPETSALLQLIGVPNTVHAVAGSSAPGLTFTPQRLPLQVTVVITTACSGIYSFGIFAAAFVAFVLMEYRSLSRGVWLLLGLGLATAYVANILRMVVIVLIGYYTSNAESDLQNMLVAHSYAGWLIFLGWLAPFWTVLLRFAPDEPSGEAGGQRGVSPSKQSMLCAICSGPLTPLVAATRCECGAYLHRSCLATTRRCVVCGHWFGVEGSPPAASE